MKIGEIDPTLYYDRIYIRATGGTNSTINFAYDTQIMVVSGPPIYVKIDMDGSVLLLDNYGYYLGTNSLYLIFYYQDCVTVTDKYDNTLKLHWHKIADSDAVRALKVAADALEKAEDVNKTLSDVDRLKNTFGTVTDVDGVTLSKAVAVKDSNNKVRTIIDGSGSYTKIGEIAIAAGVDTSASNISDGIHNAKLKIFNSGSLTIGETLTNSSSGKFPIYLHSNGGGHLACGNIN